MEVGRLGRDLSNIEQDNFLILTPHPVNHPHHAQHQSRFPGPLDPSDPRGWGGGISTIVQNRVSRLRSACRISFIGWRYSCLD